MCQLDELFALREHCAELEATLETTRVMPTDSIEYFDDGVALPATSDPSAFKADRSRSADTSPMPWMGGSSLEGGAGQDGAGASTSHAMHIWWKAKAGSWQPAPSERTHLPPFYKAPSTTLSASGLPNYHGSNVTFALRCETTSTGSDNKIKNESPELVQLRDFEWLGRKITFESCLSSRSRDSSLP